MSSLNDMRILHSHPRGEHTTVGASKGNNWTVGVVHVRSLNGLNELDIVKHCLVDSQILNVIRGKAAIAKWSGFSVVSVLSEKNEPIDLRWKGLSNES